MKTLKRRRQQGKTDYLNRLKLLKGNSPRIVFRRTNNYFTAQYVTSKAAQDKIEIGIDTKKLLKYGWPEKAKSGLKSTPAAYFLGIMIGNQIKRNKLEKPIVDFGMLRVMHKAKVCAFLKGLIDSGIAINCKKEAFPTNERIRGEHMKTKIPFDEIKSKIEKA
ncbi:MAG: 50S ribosomal protein L18 [Nanoarchaeota archaeon]